MEKDKKILIVTSGVFLSALVFMLFLTFQSRDNIISDVGRIRINDEIQLGDYTCSASLVGTVYGNTTNYYSPISSNCSNSTTAGTCYQRVGSADTSNCGSDDGDDCYEFKKYTVTCSLSSCPAGQGADSSASSGCSNCSAGWYSAAGSTTCSKCDAGYFSKAGAGSCTKCGPGYYSSSQASSSCTYCSGTKQYTSGYGATSCSTCGSGKVANSNHSGCVDDDSCSVSHCETCVSGNADSCSICESGYHKSGTGCVANPTSCPAGQGLNSNYTCAACGDGYWSEEGSVSCSTKCPVGYVCKNGVKTECATAGVEGMSTCPATACSVTNCNTCVSDDSTRCQTCKSGYTVTSSGTCELTCNASNCRTCVSGSATACATCNSGYRLSGTNCVAITAPCCITNSDNSKTQYDSDYACRQAASLGATISYSACPTSTPTCSVSNCNTCKTGDVNTCVSCKTGYVVSSTGQCTEITAPCCVSGTTVTDTNGCKQAAKSGASFSLGACLSNTSCGVENCTTCSSTDLTKCSVCKSGYHVYSGTCVADPTSCPAGQGLDSFHVCSTCGNGYWSEEGSISCATKCPVGYVCKNGVKTECPTATVEGLSTCPAGTCTISNCSECDDEPGEVDPLCVKCNGGYYLSNGSCKICPEGSYCPPGSTTPSRCGDGKTSIPGSVYNYECTACEDGYYSNSATSGKCVSCPGYVNDAKSYCNTECSKGFYKGQHTCDACEAGFYCPNGTDKHACPTGTTSSIKAESEEDCYVKEDINNCNLTVSTASIHTSVATEGTSDKNSYYTVRVDVTGKGCNGQALSYSVKRNGTASPTHQSNISSGSTYFFNVYTVTPCADSLAEAILTNGKSGTAGISKDNVRTEWTCTSGCWTLAQTQGVPKGFHDADRAGIDEYYTDLKNFGTPTACYQTHCVRYGCGTSTQPSSYCYVKYGTNAPNSYCFGTASECSGYTTTISSSTCDESAACYKRKSDGTYVYGKYSNQTNYFTYYGTSCPRSTNETPSCYVKRGSGTDNMYCYGTSSTCSGYTEVLFGRTETNCKEAAACYRRLSDGKYVSGKYDNQSGYQYYGTTCPNEACYRDTTGHYYWTDSPKENDIEITSIAVQTECVDPSSEACYVDGSGSYHWTSTPDSSWTPVTTANDPVSCGPNEPDGCYKNTLTGEYQWGKYAKVIGWQKVASITDRTKCVRPDPACYRDSVGNYVWGNYEDKSNYSVVTGIYDAKDCKDNTPVVVVPPTALSIFNIVYVAVCLFMMSGVAILCYTKRKNSNIKLKN